MTANVTVLGAKLNDTLNVPNSVLRFRPSAAVMKQTGLPAVQADKQQVYVVAGGKLTAVPVKFGISDGRYTAVDSSQLQARVKVVVRATMSGSAATSSSTTSTPTAPRM
jgi:hypothetical protein